MRYAGRAAGLLCLFTATSCRLPPVERLYPAPTAQQLVVHLEHRRDGLRTLRAEAKVEYSEGHERIRLPMAFAVERPARLRIEADSPFGGQTAATLTSDGLMFDLLDARRQQFFRGPATPCNLARLLRVRLRPEDAVEVLLGGTPLGEPLSVGWNPHRGGREVLTMRGAAGETIVVELDGRRQAWDVLSVELRSGEGKTLWRLDNEDFAVHGEVRLPGVTWLEDSATKAGAKIRFRARETNVALESSIFHLEPPPGITVAEVTCD